MSMTLPPTRRWRLVGFVLSATGAMLFAIKGVLIKLIYAYHIDTTTLLMLRMLLSLPVFVGIGLLEWRRRRVEARPDARAIGLAALVGILGYYVSAWLDLEGLQTLEAQTERLILFTYPFLVIVFGRLLLNHPLRGHAVAGAALSYIGLIVMFHYRVSGRVSAQRAIRDTGSGGNLAGGGGVGLFSLIDSRIAARRSAS